jgi:putative copper export protein
MKVFKKILGPFIVLIILVVMLTIAYLPTWLIGPEGKTGQTLCYFLFLTILLIEFVLLVVILSKAKK